MDADEADRRDNEIVVTGALVALLTNRATLPDDALELVENEAAILVQVPFMKSRYRLTVTMEDESEGPTQTVPWVGDPEA